MPPWEDTLYAAGKMKRSHRKCEEAPKKYDENRRASSSFGMLNGANAAYGKVIWKAPPLKRFKGGTAILCGDKGMDAPHLMRFCGTLCGGVHFQGLLRPFGARAIAAQWGEPRLLVPQKYKEKKRCKNASLFSWCTFRDSNPGPID